MASDQPQHYLMDVSRCPGAAWRVVAAHHLLTSRHAPGISMSIAGVDGLAAHLLRTYSLELGLAGLWIPDNGVERGGPTLRFVTDDPIYFAPDDPISINVPASVSPSVLSELVLLALETHESPR